MAEVLREFEDVLVGPDGASYTARAAGREREDGLWEGWLEFLPTDGGAPVRTARETTQPNHRDVLYWSTGLTWAYLDGALTRTLAPRRKPRTVEADSRPPHPRPHEPARGAPPSGEPKREPIAILDPFAVYAEGDDVLRGQLHALDEAQLRNIIRSFALSSESPERLGEMSREELAGLIVAAVEVRVSHAGADSGAGAGEIAGEGEGSG